MNIAMDRFCVNRKTAPSLDIETFFRAVCDCGLNKVELRNDLADPSIIGGKTTGELNALAEKYGIEIVTINALYPFNLPSRREALAVTAKEMLGIARAVSCKAIILCPYNEPDVRSTERKKADMIDSLRYFAELFATYGIEGLVEPLGFTGSSLRSSLGCQELLEEARVPFKMVIDTFHHHLSGVTTEGFNKGINVDRIGLVHLSGVEDSRPVEDLTDEERIMLTPKDVLQSKEQTANLERLGYKGLYSFEPFASSLGGWDAQEMKRQVLDSISLLQH